MPTRLHRAARTSFVRRAAAVAVAGLCLAAIPIAPGTAGAADAARLTLPPQGLYEGCAPADNEGVCAAHLAEIRSAGFRYVLNYSSWYGSPADVLRYADTAAALGLQLIWPLNNPAWRNLGSLSATYPSLSGGRLGLSNEEFTSLAIDLVAEHPATWGFYIGDEVSPLEANQVGALSAAVRRLAPDKPQLYVARPGAARLEPFVPFADVAGVDTYPVGSADPPVWHVARATRAVTNEADVQTAIVLQAFSWSQYLPGVFTSFPGGRSLRIMRDSAIRHANPSMILWYSYQDILRSNDPERHWGALARAAFSPIAPAPPPICGEFTSRASCRR